MILRYGSAIVVEVAPETSNLALFLIFNLKEIINKLLLYFTPFKSTAVAFLLTRGRTRFEILNSNANMAEQERMYIVGPNKGHMRKFDINPI